MRQEHGHEYTHRQILMQDVYLNEDKPTEFTVDGLGFVEIIGVRYVKPFHIRILFENADAGRARGMKKLICSVVMTGWKCPIGYKHLGWCRADDDFEWHLYGENHV